MIDIVQQCEYDMSDPVLKYCVSWDNNFVCKDALEHLINSWTLHKIPRPLGCIPIENMPATRRNWILPETLISTTPEAVRMYEGLGGSLSRDSSFGWDPLAVNEEGYQNRVAIGRPIFSDVVHGKKDRLQRVIEYFYQLTGTLSQWSTILKKFTGSLTLSWQSPLSHRNQSIDLQCRSVGWFLYDRELLNQRIKKKKQMLWNLWPKPVRNSFTQIFFYCF